MAATSSNIGVWNRALGRIGVSKLVQSEDENTPEAEQCGLIYDDVVRELLEKHDWRFAKRQRPISKIDSQTVTYDGVDTDGVEDTFVVPYPFTSSADLTVEIDDVEVDADGYTITEAEGGVDATITLDTPPGASTTLTITVTTTREGWEHVYVLPADCVKPLALLGDGVRIDLAPQAARPEWEIFPSPDGQSQYLACDLDEDDFDALEYIYEHTYVPGWTREFLNAVVWRMAVDLALSIKKDPVLSERMALAYEEYCSRAFARDQNNAQQSQEPTTPSVAARG